MAPALELRAVTKRFDDVVALDEASLTVLAGSLHMLLGENGAGKSTLLRIAAGFTKPDAGALMLHGVPAAWRSRADALRSGIAAVEQHFSLVGDMTVAENVALAARPVLSRFRVAEAAAEVLRISEAVGLPIDPHAPVHTLPVAAQQRAEIIKALAVNASTLLLDEPTAVLSPGEADDLFAWLRGFVATGRAVVVTTHRVREALQHGDALTVLRMGRSVLTGEPASIGHQAVINALLGDDRPRAFGSSRPAVPTPAADDDVVAQLEDVSVVDIRGVRRLHRASLRLHRAEIVGVAGVEGSGRRELLRVAAGRLAATEGTLMLPEHVGFIPEDRLRDAVAAELSLAENHVLRGLGARRGRIDWAAERAATRTSITEYSIRALGPSQRAATLSGGNQQRLVLARELAGNPTLIVAENPTRGLDIRAADDVLHRLVSARKAGASVLLYTSDVDELLSIADRVVVCFGGRVTAVAASRDAVGAAMLGT